jgi:hypothetical protein
VRGVWPFPATARRARSARLGRCAHISLAETEPAAPEPAGQATWPGFGTLPVVCSGWARCCQ